MTSPNDENSTEKDSCCRENCPQAGAVLPSRKQPAASSSEGARVWDNARAEQIDEGCVDFISLLIRLDEARVMPLNQVKQVSSPSQSIEPAKPKMLSPGELHRLYAGTSVPQHRYLAPWLTVAANSPEIALDPEKWLAQIAGINLSSAVDAWLNTNCNTDYEQLHGIGLDQDTGQLTAAITLKQGSGYSGGPCAAGSSEYVTFWVDWGSGFQYEGTASAVVHDLTCLPADGLKYNVSLPADFRTHLQHCDDKEKTVRVRAVLSWNTPSSATDPDAPVVWGNRLESNILISFARTIQANNQISRIAGTCGTDIDGIGRVGNSIDAAIKWLPLKQTGSAVRSGSRLVPRRNGVTFG